MSSRSRWRSRRRSASSPQREMRCTRDSPLWDDSRMRGRGRQLLAVAVVAAAAIAGTGAKSASASSPLKITNCNTAVRRPKLLVLSCGDGNTALKGLSWSSFGGSTARAKGTFVMNTYEPNCAAGRDVSFKVNVKATNPRTCKRGLRVYNRVTLQFIGHAPSERNDFTRWTLGCPI